MNPWHRTTRVVPEIGTLVLTFTRDVGHELMYRMSDGWRLNGAPVDDHAGPDWWQRLTDPNDSEPQEPQEPQRTLWLYSKTRRQKLICRLEAALIIRDLLDYEIGNEIEAAAALTEDVLRQEVARQEALAHGTE